MRASPAPATREASGSSRPTWRDGVVGRDGRLWKVEGEVGEHQDQRRAREVERLAAEARHEADREHDVREGRRELDRPVDHAPDPRRGADDEERDDGGGEHADRGDDSPSLMLLMMALRAAGSLKMPSRYALRLRLPQGISGVQKPSSETITSANSGRIVDDHVDHDARDRPAPAAERIGVARWPLPAIAAKRRAEHQHLGEPGRRDERDHDRAQPDGHALVRREVCSTRTIRSDRTWMFAPVPITSGIETSPNPLHAIRSTAPAMPASPRAASPCGASAGGPRR